jgi:hypothetical protein
MQTRMDKYYLIEPEGGGGGLPGGGGGGNELADAGLNGTALLTESGGFPLMSESRMRCVTGTR